MVEVGKIGGETLVLDGRYISIFRAGKLVWKRAYRGYILPDGNLYSYRRRVRITELSGKTLTDYQVKIEIRVEDPIFAHARSAGEDIRFCYYPEENMIPYWIEKFDPDAEEAIIWVKVPKIPANSTMDIYLYYGNPTVASASDGDAVFEIFDDFEEASLDTSKWLNAGTETWSVENGNLVIEPTSNNQYLVSRRAVGSYGIIIESRIKAEQAGDSAAHPGLIWHANTETGSSHRNDHIYFRPHQYGDGSFPNIQPAYFDGALNQHSGKYGSYFDWNTWYEIKVEIINSSTIKLYGNGELWHTWGNQQYSYEHVGFVAHANGKDYFDYIRVRKYASPEPSVSVGREE